MPEGLRINAMTDELAWDVREGLALGRELGVTGFSTRFLNEKERVPYVNEDDLAVVDAMLEDGWGRIECVSPGTNKFAYSADELDDMINKDLKAAIDLAKRWNCNHVSLFSWMKAKDAERPLNWGLSASMPEGCVDGFKRMADMAEREDIVLSIENCHPVWADNGLAAAEMIERVGSTRIKQVWDIANALASRCTWGLAEDSPEMIDPMKILLDELDVVYPNIIDVHVRDLKMLTDGWEWVLLGEGVVDWPRLMDALLGKGYDGPLTMEHHFHHDKTPASHHTHRFLTELLGDRIPA